MNPGKVIDPYRVDENLREGTAYNLPPGRRRTSIFPTIITPSRPASDRCVGAGVCRRHERRRHHVPELHGHARREALHPRPGPPAERDDPRRRRQGRLADEAVREALDLCLSCKGCKHDCPVQVDMATYKAEFLSHYYEGRLRPAVRLCFGTDLLVGATRRAHARDGQFLHANAGLQSLGEVRRRVFAETPTDPAVRAGDIQALVRAAGARNDGKPA